MIEGELHVFELLLRKPSGLGGVVAAFRLSSYGDRVVQHGHVVSSRVPIGIRIDAEKPSHLDFEARLLERLAGATVFSALLPFEKAARKPPSAGEGRAAPPDEEKPPGVIPDPCIDGDARDLFSPVEQVGIPQASSGFPAP